MKNKAIFALFLILLFTLITFSISAQTITVTPVEKTYKRPKPESEWKKEFTVTRPKVRGATPALAKKIETAISYETNLNFKLQEELREYQWLQGATYELDYNKKGILGVTLSMEGNGAYPSVSTKPVIVNIKTGTKVTTRDVFTNTTGLVTKLKAMLKAEIKQAIIDIKKDFPEEEDPTSLFENSKFTAKDLKEFTVSDEGVTFWYDYNFPHVILAREPEGRYFMTWAQLKPYIKPGSLFAQFIR